MSKKVTARPRLIVRRLGECWHVDYVNTPEADEVRHLFDGTTVLPTPFPLVAPADKVRERIARLNPQYDVIVEGK